MDARTEAAAVTAQHVHESIEHAEEAASIPSSVAAWEHCKLALDGLHRYQVLTGHHHRDAEELCRRGLAASNLAMARELGIVDLIGDDQFSDAAIEAAEARIS